MKISEVIMYQKFEEINIYNMKLHDIFEIKDRTFTGTITRVPGGWIYERDMPGYSHSTSTFVPLDNEFQRTDYE
jgi:hypothetical protein